ncbi:solute carrier family 13 (sodium-dependent dicarboxylate transporter), member 2/3/5 [Georgenia satyanarayanai]|uniref:Sodium-dependent dicarboxylate transporter SdcS n=1 Tax=Georgenia satyanarayanai TaxID=860221 RepID=A0A2Y9C2U6_9MICO|nr:DASS family sodium-coupled anion symporter [Georgenia satyanarayanai]PYG01900.1 sodium-dependent dicarboxylate transporter 2/3/5 [Georgenia satyanarayanai]SSA36703.1 solute carrier family 13 (sodium-dependent dicarboxylate transporter), member 2/3/5 [Georgenia satyanarayanai]
MTQRPVPGDHLRDYSPRPRGGDDEDNRSPGERTEPLKRTTWRNRLLGLAAGLGGGLLVFLLLPGDLAVSARVTAATAVLMGLWWMTEAIPIPATALVPLVVFPIFNETTAEDGTTSPVTVDQVGASYGNNIIFLFMGGFLLALAMQRWNLHRRIALVTVRAMGTSPSMVVAGFMVATAFLSMWVSNTATAVMMLPIGVSVLLLVARLKDEVPAGAPGGEGETDLQSEEVKEHVIESTFGTALMLGIAYAASIGSLSTIIGTPPNTLLVGYLADNHDIRIGFGQWMLVGLPLAVVFLVICWFLLTKVLFKPEISEIPGGRDLMNDELAKLGPMSSGEKRVLALFVLAAVSWVAIPLIFDEPFISDAGIAMAVGLLLFLSPSGSGRGVRLLDWDSAVKLPWGVLLLFGGGLALSSQFGASGLTGWIGEQAEALGGAPVILVVVVLVALVIFLTELTSNTATAATFLPVVGGLAIGIGMPVTLATIPVAIAATCAFMLPVATPPNAIAFGSGYVTIPQMLRGGIWLNLIGVVLITATAMTLAVWVFGIVY